MEGGLTPSYILIESGIAELLHHVVNYSFPAAFGKSQSRDEYRSKREVVEAKRAEIDSKRITTVFGDFERHQENGLDFGSIHRAQREWLDASCWHRNQSESMAMWKIYGSSTNAVCIESNVAALHDSISLAEGDSIFISNVHYIDHENEHFKIDHPLAPYLHKSKFYEFEDEIRVIKYNQSSDIFSSRENFGSSVTVDINKLIKSVRVSPSAPEWFYELIRCTVRDRYHIDVPVIYSRMKRDPLYDF